MGVDNAWPFLASIEGLEFPEVEPKDAYAKVHLDVPAIYFALFRSIQCHKAFSEMKKQMNAPVNIKTPYVAPANISGLLASIKVPPPTSKRTTKTIKLEVDVIKKNPKFLSTISPQSTLPPVPDTFSGNDTSTPLDKVLLKKFSKDQAILHFDGPKTTQKRYAHEKREASRTGSIANFVQKAATVLAQIAVLQSQVDKTTAAGNPKPTKNQILRVVKVINRSLLKAWINTKAVPHRDWKALAEQLDEKGWTVHGCTGEADVCISRHAEEEEEDTVVASADSDNLFHGAAFVLRKSPRGGRFFTYDIGAVLGSLRISYEQWQAIAVLAENDYDQKLPGQSFATIVETIRDMPNKPTSNDYVNDYCSMQSIDPTSFKNSTDIFIDNKEDRDMDAVSENNGTKLVDHLMMHVVNEVSKLRQR